MSKKKVLILVGVVVVLGLGAWYFLSKRGTATNNFQLVEVTRGDVQSIVSATGTLSALVTVQVGTQVSGIIDKLYADFNQHVTKGQLLAVLDKEALNASVRDAEANVDRARATLAQAQDDYDRNEPLLKKGYLSAEEFNNYRGSVAVAKASLRSAQAALDRARTNLGFAEIRSPINGTIIQRSVDVGQTVAASLSAPTIFLIAEDLAHMQIQASVDESDIGAIKQGQKATFTVQAYPDKTFEGRVSQIRLQPTTVQNVVNYTVIVDTENPEGVLIPGMTATIDFEVQAAHDVLVVPNAALRFQPTAEMLAAGRSGSGRSDSSRAGSSRRAAGGDSARSAGARKRTSANSGRLWTVDSNGALQMIPVKVGLSDGQMTQVESPRLREGVKVVTGVQQPAGSATRTSTTPGATGLPGAGGQGGARRGGGLF
jgi:HlyD family secretion protein